MCRDPEGLSAGSNSANASAGTNDAHEKQATESGVRSPKLKTLKPGRAGLTRRIYDVPSRNVYEKTRCRVPCAKSQGVNPGSRVQTGGLAQVQSQPLESYVPSRNVYENKRELSDSQARSRKVSAFGAPVLTPGSFVLTPALQEMKGHPEMLLKTKDGVRTPGSEVRSRMASAAGASILTPVSLLLTPALQEMKVHPEMLLKTREGVRTPGSEVRSRMASAFGAPVLTPVSFLLTPALQEMKVHPEMLMKTKERFRSPSFEVRMSHGLRGWYACSDSRILTPTPAFKG